MTKTYNESIQNLIVIETIRILTNSTWVDHAPNISQGQHCLVTALDVATVNICGYNGGNEKFYIKESIKKKLPVMMNDLVEFNDRANSKYEVIDLLSSVVLP